MGIQLKRFSTNIFMGGIMKRMNIGELGTKQTETVIVNVILHNLNKFGSFDRVSNIPAYNEKIGGYKRMSSHARKGASDISGTFKGRPVYIEVKTPDHLKKVLSYYHKIKHDIDGNKPLETEKWKTHIWEQIIYLRDKHDHGAICFFSCDHNHCIDTINKGIESYGNHPFLFLE